ncbi:MAG TPA: DNA polymerase III subunit [Candidatus Binatia bacterium]|jgi:DNA polymerase-3 subunit delta'|nr:DNA polymerase III subunit [Candidatus Binatia bacterium]
MAFKDFPGHQQGVQLLQRSLERGRLGHAYLFSAHQLEPLEALALTLAKTLNCQNPIKKGGVAIDCCDQCLSCRKIEHGNHADVHWVRPESKTRIIRIEQIRDLIQEMNLKPTEAQYKVAVIVAADRLKTEAANAFLKTLEEPPARSVLILLSTEPQRILETLLSRCLRLNFGGEGQPALAPAQMEWLKSFSEIAAAEQKSLLGRYRLADVLLRKLNEIKSGIDETLTARSPLEQYKDAEKQFTERWEDELAAAIEAEYRRQRADLLVVLQWWLRDVWVQTLQGSNAKHQTPNTSLPARDSQPPAASPLLSFPQLAGTGSVAGRISPSDALENLQVMEQLQRWLGTNVQEALALEVGLLKLRL